MDKAESFVICEVEGDQMVMQAVVKPSRLIYLSLSVSRGRGEIYWAVILGQLIIFINYCDSQFTPRFQNKSHFLRKFRVNCELQAMRNIVGHSAFVNAINPSGC